MKFKVYKGESPSELLAYCYKWLRKVGEGKDAKGEYEIWESDSPLLKGEVPDHLKFKDKSGNLVAPKPLKEKVEKLKERIVK